MVQDAYNVTKAMRKRGIKADLLLPASDFVFSNPAWEDYELEVSDTDRCEKIEFKAPEWIKILKQKLPGKTVHIEYLIRVRSIVKNYDVVFAHAPSSMYCQFYHTPWIPYDAGLIRYLPLSRKPLTPHGQSFFTRYSFKLLKRSYEKAKKIIYTNPDTYSIFEEAGLSNKLTFIPFAILTDKYKPMSKKGMFKGYDVVFFMPSRHHWVEKGTDKVIRAFSRFISRNEKSLLIMVDWGKDIEASKQLIVDLNIPSSSYKLIKPVQKNQLIKLYNEVDVILDQFTLGSWGTTTPEAMACQKPVIMYYNKRDILRCFGSEPPIFNSHAIDEIAASMESCLDYSLREEMGRKARKWIEETHGPDIVVNLHLQVAKEMLQ
jgi:glycosyltransferase involved in cell wall biosynthesis